MLSREPYSGINSDDQRIIICHCVVREHLSIIKMKKQRAFVLAVICMICLVAVMTILTRHDKDVGSPRSNFSGAFGTRLADSKCQNDPECTKFHRLIDTEWPLNKPRGAVVMLISRRSVESEVFRTFAEHFDKNFNDAFRYPLIIFHESHANESDKQLLRSWTRSTLYFHLVEFVLPPSVDESQITNHCGRPGQFPIGYRHMCRFQAKTIYEKPILAIEKLEYIWRLDDDSVITKPIAYDIFDFMQSRHLQYGYALVSGDSPDCVIGLEEAVQHYVDGKSIKRKFTWKLPTIIYNNFEIAELKLWRSAQYTEFIEYIDSTSGIYRYRWGDAPIKSLAVSIFVAKNATHHFGDIGYRHQGSENSGRGRG